MSENTKLERLAAHYDSTDTSAELAEATCAPPEAPAAGEPMTTFAVRLPAVVLDRVRRIADQRDSTTSAVIRQWIEAGIAFEAADDDDRFVPVRDLLALIGRTPAKRAAS